jgi:hypothetical protein
VFQLDCLFVVSRIVFVETLRSAARYPWPRLALGPSRPRSPRLVSDLSNVSADSAQATGIDSQYELIAIQQRHCVGWTFPLIGPLTSFGIRLYTPGRIRDAWNRGSPDACLFATCGPMDISPYEQACPEQAKCFLCPDRFAVELCCR